MPVDNFEKIIPLLQFPHKDSFYFVQILQRKKDHKGITLGGSNNNSRLVKAYYITSVEKLQIHREEMIKLAEVFNARVSINLNPRSFEKAAFQVLIKIANQMHNRDFYEVRKAYDSICGEYHNEMDRRWLIDIDDPDPQVAQRVAEFIQSLQEQIKNKDYNVLAILPSKNGWHVITNPFNLETFQMSHHREHSVHKNNPTTLYCL